MSTEVIRTGVHSVNSIEHIWDIPVQSNLEFDLAFKKHEESCNDVGCKSVAHQGFSDLWEDGSGDTKLIGDWKVNEKGEWERDEDGPCGFSALLRETVVQVVWSKTTGKFKSMCGFCYPMQVDCDSGPGDIEAYTLPADVMGWDLNLPEPKFGEAKQGDEVEGTLNESQPAFPKMEMVHTDVFKAVDSKWNTFDIPVTKRKLTPNEKSLRGTVTGRMSCTEPNLDTVEPSGFGIKKISDVIKYQFGQKFRNKNLSNCLGDDLYILSMIEFEKNTRSMVVALICMNEGNRWRNPISVKEDAANSPDGISHETFALMVGASVDAWEAVDVKQSVIEPDLKKCNICPYGTREYYVHKIPKTDVTYTAEICGNCFHVFDVALRTTVYGLFTPPLRLDLEDESYTVNMKEKGPFVWGFNAVTGKGNPFRANTLWRQTAVLRKNINSNSRTGYLVGYKYFQTYQSDENRICTALYKFKGYRYTVAIYFDQKTGERIA